MHSRNRLQVLFSTDNNKSITASYACKTILQFNEFALKVHLLHQDSTQVIRHIISNGNNILHTKVIDIEENITSIQIRVPIQNRDLKCCIYKDEFNSFRYELICFESTVLRFNTNNYSNNFWFFSNRYTKKFMQGGKDLIFNMNYSL